MKKMIFFIAFALTGCASHSGIVAMGPNTYFVSKQAATGIGGMENLKAEVYGEAGQFCGAKGLVPQVIHENETRPPYVFGNYPRIEIQFQCITKESRPPLSSFYK